MSLLRRASIALLSIAGLLGIAPATSAQTSETWTNVYDIRNRLVEVRHGSDILLRLEYDAQSRLLKKIGAEGVRQYVYDGSNLLEELDGDGNEIAKYDWGAGPYGRDQLIRFTQINAPGQPSFYPVFDGNGSVTGLTDSNGTPVVGYHLDAWGNFRFAAEINASTNRFAYTAYRFMPEVNLYFAVSRFYDPKIGRFLTRDTYLGDIADVPTLHRYQYSRNNPTGYIDPDGHESFRQWIGLDKPTASVEVEFLKNFGYNAWDALSLGALSRQDSLVERSEAGLISEGQYLAGTGINLGGTLAVAAGSGGAGGTVARLVGGSLRASFAAGGAAAGFLGSTGNAALDVATGKRDLGEVTASEIVLGTAIGGATGGLLGAAAQEGTLPFGRYLSSSTRPSPSSPLKSTKGVTVAEGRSGVEFVPLESLNGGVVPPGELAPTAASLRPGVSPLRELDIDHYGTFNNTPRVGDSLAGHELLQNAWLREHGYVQSRGSGPASRSNPAIALSDELHARIGLEQRKLGLFDRAKLQAMSAAENIALNAQAMRNAGLSEHVVQTLQNEALLHASTLAK